MIDTLGRTIVQKTVNGSQTYYDVLISQGSSSNPQERSRYTVTTSSINVDTAFGQSGVTEFSGTITVISSIGLPDGSSYSFTYDTGTTPGFYGLLSSLTLPETGQITYAFTTFQDAYGTRNRWLSSRTLAGGTWTTTPSVISTCSPGTSGCQQQMLFTKPSNDQFVYTFTINNGAWNTGTSFYNGSASGGTLLRSVSTDYDFSNACPLSCSGNAGDAYIRPIRVTTSEPVPNQTVSKKTEFSYDSIYNGSITSAKEWAYYVGTPPSTPDHETDTNYVTSSNYTTKDIRSAVSSLTIKSGSGTQLSQTNFTYDSTALTSVTGVVQHDDTNYGTSNTVRGNSTVIQKWVSGSTYLSTTMTYDTTGQVLQIQNPRGYSRLYSYADIYFLDNGSNPPLSYSASQPTNAFVTDVQLVNSQNSAHIGFGYYFNTGKRAFERDENLARVYHHFIDPLDRQTHVYDRLLLNGTRGWTLTNYESQLQWGIYTAISDTTPSTSCTHCRHDQLDFDNWGRGTISNNIMNDPDGTTYVHTVYGPVGRVASVSNPYRSTSDPTYGLDSYTYDGLDRLTKTTHQDSNTQLTDYGSAVISGGGIGTQLCSASTYGIGFPTLTVDEAGKLSQAWTDAFGRTIEADEPDSSSRLTLGTCYSYDGLGNQLMVVQGSQTRSYIYDGLSRLMSATEPESGTTTRSYTNSSGGLCSGSEKDVCRLTDARGVVTTFTYDSINRLTGRSYSDGTANVTYHYDQTTFNGLTIQYGGGRRTGMVDGSGQTAWSYDPAGHIVAEQRTIAGITKTISYTYNLDGSIASVTYPSGRIVSYTYGNAQRPTSAVDTSNGINYATSATYAPQGALSNVVFGKSSGFNGLSGSSTYNNRLQLTSDVASSTNGTVRSVAYNYDVGGGSNNGSVASVTNNLDTGRTETLSYDSMNRLSSAESQATSGSDCWGQSLGYDRYGNLTNATVTQCSAPALNLTINNNNQIADSPVTYDAAGNMTNDGISTYSYDAEHRPTAANGISYVYDGDNWRVEKSGGPLYWDGVACGQDLLAESDTAGNITEEFVYFYNSRIARRDVSTGNVYYYLSDQIDSSRVMTDSNGVTQWESDYYPFGGERTITTNVANSFKFTGKERDSESSLDYSFRRMYSSQYGRWMSTDPISGKVGEPQSNNRYTYVINNPPNLKDPNGLFVIPICISFTIPCSYPPNKYLCTYYRDLTLFGDACDRLYAPIAYGVCRFAGTSCFENCYRACLIQGDKACRQRYPALRQCVQRSFCREAANHAACIPKCGPSILGGTTFHECFFIPEPDFCDSPDEFFGCSDDFIEWP
ncbi:MAG TPA: RHS repeat-associated core domain-containing protein [Terriglobales bacterium]|nr:RHS repeat-associated core domain-containing protein [Terriglobales bacterium]